MPVVSENDGENETNHGLGDDVEATVRAFGELASASVGDAVHDQLENASLSLCLDLW